MADILFPKNNESELSQEAKEKNLEYVFGYYSLSAKCIVLTDQIIKKIGLNRLRRNADLVIYDGKYSSEFILPLVKRGVIDIVFGLEWNSDKDGYKSPATKLTPEVVQAMKQKDITYGFCISDIIDEIQKNPDRIIPRLAQNAVLFKKKVIFSGKSVYSQAEKEAISQIFVR
jgi:hypothetical protein